VRTSLIVMVVTALGVALLACTSPELSAEKGSTASIGYGARSQIERAPLPPLEGFAPAPTGFSSQGDTQTLEQRGWQASKSWSAVKGDGCISVESDAEDPSRPGPIKRC
jgi:hypothetical protein